MLLLRKGESTFSLRAVAPSRLRAVSSPPNAPSHHAPRPAPPRPARSTLGSSLRPSQSPAQFHPLQRAREEVAWESPDGFEPNHNIYFVTREEALPYRLHIPLSKASALGLSTLSGSTYEKYGEKNKTLQLHELLCFSRMRSGDTTHLSYQG